LALANGDSRWQLTIIAFESPARRTVAANWRQHRAPSLRAVALHA
jgi:hypothetical protein